MHRVDVVYPPVLVVAGMLLWLAVYESGVHATIAGVVMGLLTPARPIQTELEAEEVVDVLEGPARPPRRGHPGDGDGDQGIGVGVRPADRRAAPVDELRHRARSSPWPTPASCCRRMRSRSRRPCSPGSPSGWSSASCVGVAGFSWLAVRLGLGRLPDGARWGHIVGVAAVAGIGFTVSLFITGLAFDTASLQDDAKIGTLTASIVAAPPAPPSSPSSPNPHVDASQPPSTTRPPTSRR